MQDRSERLKIQKDILWGIYQEHRTHARHNETLRSAVTNMLIVASAALVSIVIYDKSINREDLGAAVLLIGFGLLGIAFNFYYTTKIFKHKKRADKYLDEFSSPSFFEGEERSPNTILTEVDTTYEDDLKKKLWNRPYLIRVAKKIGDSFALWSILPLLISLIGAYLTVMSIIKKNDVPALTNHPPGPSATQQSPHANSTPSHDSSATPEPHPAPSTPPPANAPANNFRPAPTPASSRAPQDRPRRKNGDNSPRMK